MKDMFHETLMREGKHIKLKGWEIRVFFRRNNKGNVDNYLTMYTPKIIDPYGTLNLSIKQGDMFSFEGNDYIVFKKLTPENDIYNKYICIETNTKVKFMLKLNQEMAELHEFKMFQNDTMADSLSSKGSVIVSTSSIEFILPLDDFSRRILINDRFFNEFHGLAWKITDINYKDGLAILYCERDIISPNDDTENGIANRWKYEPKPDAYEITISEEKVELQVDGKVKIEPVLKKNGEVYKPIKTFTWKSDNPNVADAINDEIIAKSKGYCQIFCSYKEKDTDTCKGAYVNVTVKEKPMDVNIVVNPPYNSDGKRKRHAVSLYDKVTFTCSLSENIGIEPKWEIKLDTTVPNYCYVSTINNANGTFTVENKETVQDNYLTYHIKELNTGKTVDYIVELYSLF